MGNWWYFGIVGRIGRENSVKLNTRQEGSFAVIVIGEVWEVHVLTIVTRVLGLVYTTHPPRRK